jgi:hypothetical protein
VFERENGCGFSPSVLVALPRSQRSFAIVTGSA